MDRVWYGLNLSMSALFQIIAGSHAGSSAAYDLFEENCEGTGTPSGWSGTGANWDYTTTVLQGAQSLSMSGTGTTQYDFADQATAEAYCLIQVPSIPASSKNLFGLRNVSSPQATVQINSSGQLGVYANGSLSTVTTDALTAGVTYHCWLRFNASSTCSIAFSTDGVRPSSGNKFTSKTGGSGIVNRFTVNGDINTTIFDRMIGSTTAIGNSP